MTPKYAAVRGEVSPSNSSEEINFGNWYNMNIQTPDVSSFNQSRSQIAADMARQIARSSRNL